MRVLFFVSLFNHGRGGHIHSLMHISKELSKKDDVKIVSIGNKKANKSTISKSSNYISHIEFNGINLFSLKLEIDRIVKGFEPEIIHCFDINTYNLISLFYSHNKYKIAVTKCGGPNPSNYARYPYISNLILFSSENKIWFENNPRYKDTNIAFIPNRVSKISTETLDIIKPKDRFCFVKIARIGSTYKDSIFDSINLIDKLYKKNSSLKLKLFIIGVVEEPELLKEISSNKHVLDGTVTLLTDDIYTREASKMLYLADASISTGRGVMEACSLQLPVLTVNAKSDIPVLLTKDTFNDAFKTNFSGRNLFPYLKESENINNIERLIIDKKFYKDTSLYMKYIFDKYFNIENATHKYNDFYRSISLNKNIHLNAIFQIKTMYNFYKLKTK